MMTISPMNTSENRRPTAGRSGSIPAKWALRDEVEHTARLKRLVLAGALASFLGLFGLTIAFDFQTRQAQPAGQSSIVSSIRLPFSGDDDDHGGSSNTTAPQMRTKTS